MLKMDMQTLLKRQECVEALTGETLLPTRLTQTKKIKMVDKVKSVIIFGLRDTVFRGSHYRKFVVLTWVNFESLYTRSFTNLLCQKQ